MRFLLCLGMVIATGAQCAEITEGQYILQKNELACSIWSDYMELFKTAARGDVIGYQRGAADLTALERCAYLPKGQTVIVDRVVVVPGEHLQRVCLRRTFSADCSWTINPSLKR